MPPDFSIHLRTMIGTPETSTILPCGLILPCALWGTIDLTDKFDEVTKQKKKGIFPISWLQHAR